MGLYEKLKGAASGAVQAGKDKAHEKYRKHKEEGEREDRIYNEAYQKGREKYLRKKAYADAMGGGGGGLAERIANIGGGGPGHFSPSFGGVSQPKRPRRHHKEKKRPTKHRRRSHREPEYPDYW